jgi:alpha-N-arabinofuranosidase
MKWLFVYLNTFILLCCLHLYAQYAGNKIVVHADQGKDTISKNIYGHFSEHLGHCIYGGIWVGEKSDIPNTRGIRNDVVQALREIAIPNLRWPGGCFADEYHWKNGIGPREQRPSMVNTNWGGVTEDNSFGTHEFLDLCEQLGCEPIITGNVGSGTVEEMAQWVEYLTSDNISPMTDLRKKNGREKPWNIHFWGLGNEAWGCGGTMEPDYYFNQAMRYSTYCRDYGNNHLYRIASGASDFDFHWTETIMSKWAAKPEWLRGGINGLSLHYYTICYDWDHKGSATVFNEKDMAHTLYQTLRMEEAIVKHSAIMDKYDPAKKIGLVVDEWGNWFDVEPGTNPGFLFQQNTLRDALVAGINLNIFNNHCDRVKIANIAQIVNVLQSVILTKGKEIVLTPTWYVFKMYKVHQNAVQLPIELSCVKYTYDTISVKAISASASKDKDGKIHISMVNLDVNKEQVVDCKITGLNVSSVTGDIITAKAMNAYNDFGKPAEVNIRPFNAANISNRGLQVVLPPKSVVMLELQ